MGRRRGASTIASLLVTLLSGCTLIGTDPDPAAPPAGEPIAAPVTPSLLGDHDLANSALVRLEDLPAGWQPDTTAMAGAADQPDPTVQCEGLEGEGFTVLPAAESNPDASSFTDPDGNHLSTNVAIFDDTASAVLAFEALSSLAFMQCLNRVFEAELRREPTITGVEVVNQPSTTAVVADQAVAYQIQAWASSAGGVAPMTVEVRFIRVGRGVTQLIGFGMNQPPLQLFEELTKLMAGRLLSGQTA